MPEYNITLKGWKAVVVIVLVLAAYGIRIYSHVQTVDDAGRDVLTAWLLLDYQGQGPRDIIKRVQDFKAGLPVQPMTEVKPMNIAFTSISAHGLSSGMVVKVEITVDGATPPDGQPTRYFYMTHSPDGGWKVLAETDTYRYYRTLLN